MSRHNCGNFVILYGLQDGHIVPALVVPATLAPENVLGRLGCPVGLLSGARVFAA